MTTGQILGHVIGWALVAVTLWFVVSTLVRIHRELGFMSTRGFLWALAVVAGSFIGVILYRRFRAETEYVCESLFGSL